jgi:hypothetical protein
MFRRLQDSNYWHWCETCEHWPTMDYIALHMRPLGGKLCPRCTELSGEEPPLIQPSPPDLVWPPNAPIPHQDS